jgi:hypothetical protein
MMMLHAMRGSQRLCSGLPIYELRDVGADLLFRAVADAHD